MSTAFVHNIDVSDCGKQSGDQGCFKCPNCSKPHISARWYQKHLSKCPQPKSLYNDGHKKWRPQKWHWRPHDRQWLPQYRQWWPHYDVTNTCIRTLVFVCGRHCLWQSLSNSQPTRVIKGWSEVKHKKHEIFKLQQKYLWFQQKIKT